MYSIAINTYIDLGDSCVSFTFFKDHAMDVSTLHMITFDGIWPSRCLVCDSQCSHEFAERNNVDHLFFNWNSKPSTAMVGAYVV